MIYRYAITAQIVKTGVVQHIIRASSGEEARGRLERAYPGRVVQWIKEVREAG